MASNRSVDHQPAVTAHADETRLPQPIEVERERVRREVEFGGDTCGRQAFGTRFDQQAKHVEPVLLSRGRGAIERAVLFHISMIIEVYGRVKNYFDGS